MSDTISTRFPIVGDRFRPPAKSILKFLPISAPLILRREPDNQYDQNAIQVICPTSSIPDSVAKELDDDAAGYGYDIGQIMMEKEWHVGYIPAIMSAKLAPVWDSEGRKEREGAYGVNEKGQHRVDLLDD